MNKDFENLIRKIVKEEKVPGVSVTKKAQDGSKKETDAYYKEVTKKMGDYDRNLKQDSDFTPPKRDLTDDERDFHDEVELGRGMEHLRYDNVPNETFKKRQEDAIKGSKKMGNETENGDKDPVWGGSVEDFGQKLIDRIKSFAKKEEDATQTYVQFGDDIELSDKEPMIKKKKMAVESVNESETISNMEIYKDRRKQGDSPEDAALFLLDVITTGTYASKSEDEIKGYVDHIIDIYEKKGDVKEELLNSINSINDSKDEFDLSTFKVFKHYESYDDEKFVEVPFKNRKDSDLNENVSQQEKEIAKGYGVDIEMDEYDGKEIQRWEMSDTKGMDFDNWKDTLNWLINKWKSDVDMYDFFRSNLGTDDILVIGDNEFAGIDIQDHMKLDDLEFSDDLNESETEYNTKTDALNGYFKGEISAEELDNIAKDKFNSEIATKEQLDDFISNQFLQDMMSDTHNISKDELIEKVKELLSFMGSVKESNEDRNELRSVKVTFANGDVIKTRMASHLTDQEIKDYYNIGRTFNIGAGEEDNLQKVVDVEILDEPKFESITEENEINKNYTHFAINKTTNKILTGWDYSDVDKEDLKIEKNEYFLVDIKDMDENPKDYKILTKKGLEKMDIDPQTVSNWVGYNPVNESEDQYGGKTEEIKSEIETIENVDGQTPTVSINDKGLITVSGEDGKMFAEYYGTELKPWPYIDEGLEELAEKYNTYWVWETPGTIMLEPISMNESKENKEKDDAYDKFFMRKMKEFNVNSPKDLSKDQWEEIDSQWLSDDETIKITDEKVNESINNVKSNNKQKNKMKRLKFKREFNSVEDALNLIPESYKVDDKEFVMTDGNQNLRVRWEGNKDGNASVLEMSDDKHLKESVDKMFHLMNYNPADAQAKANDPENLNENEIFSKLYSDSKKGVLSESEEEGIDETATPEDTDMYEKIKEAMGVEALCDAMVLAMDTDTFKSIMEYIVRTQEITLDEGIGDWLKKKAGLKDNPEEVEARKEKLMSYLNKAKEKGWETFQYDSEKVDEETLVSKMEKNGFTGKFVPVPKRGILVYKPGAYGAGRLGSGGASQGLGV